MRKALLSILDCPICRNGSGLDLLPLQEASGGVEQGLLDCRSCGRWYAVRDGIADLVADGLREVEPEQEFLRRHADSLPGGFPASDRPVRAGTNSIQATDEDIRIREDGDYWSRFMKRHWDAGDRAIFDIRCTGSHPTFYAKGILEPDDRDIGRRYGLWPQRLAHHVFSWLDGHAGEWAVDCGCGGGQYGLEAARRGLMVAGFDPGRGNLELALRHAREQDVPIDYVRADPRYPPFKPGTIDVLLCKDSLHHVPRLDEVFPGLAALLRPGGVFSCFEHVGRSPWRDALMRTFEPFLVRKMLRRWPSVEIPGELRSDSANEDISMNLVQQVVRPHFRRVDETRTMLLAWEVEGLIHYAYGKRRWFSRMKGLGTSAVEHLMMPFQPTVHWYFRGSRRK